MAYCCCLGLRGNLDFPDFLQKKFITSTTGHTGGARTKILDVNEDQLSRNVERKSCKEIFVLP